MRKIYALVDYQGQFGSKRSSIPYRSGMNKEILQEYFNNFGMELVYVPFYKIDIAKNNYKDSFFIYTSKEDPLYLYKSYIEDVVYALEIAGARVIPLYQFIRANNNKVFMELLRTIYKFDNEIIESKHFGVYEELIQSNIDVKDSTLVVKSAFEAGSHGVRLANNSKELLRYAKSLSSSKFFFKDIRDKLRSFKHYNYNKESLFRKKFITQNFIPNLEFDWKVLIFGEKYYILRRYVRDNDFRASGSGNFIFEEQPPNGFLDYCKSIYKKLNVPNVSIDVAFNGETFFVIEFQAVYFGSLTVEESTFYFKMIKEKWEVVNEKSILEEEYARSIVEFIDENY